MTKIPNMFPKKPLIEDVPLKSIPNEIKREATSDIIRAYFTGFV
jgi:hypothetical protein